MIYYLKLAFGRPKEIYKAKDMKKRHLAAIVALLIFFVTILNMVLIFPTINSIKSDGKEIANDLPEFSVADGTLKAEEGESYIHQTNTFLFFFDPDNQTSSNEIDQNMERLQVPIGIGLFEEEVYVNLSGFVMETPYSQMDDFDNETIQGIFNELGDFSIISYIISFVILYIGLGLFTLFDLLFIILFANLFSRVLRSNLTFKENIKIAIVSALMPTLAVEIASVSNLLSTYTFELKILLSLFFFYLTIKEMSKIKPKAS
ncbi:Protein of unknown function [Marinilactibacillus piezotolerans]|uniref:Maltodextrin utilization protein YvdJ n=1 Tax=Marinilactibacillus piezotolerans TaxID=258723 RepID=A0A1I3V6R8_9LACT|nr:DUF1189 family protein [Marinilactibacillus piezotolerans]SFJ90026.1 Protein of unknown function [Marinilactibacillus piezotolerans]